ncbi:hypothetical protein Bca52824_044814 [Brassica carinata]|uniref:Hs1pro-1 C-terminal domain-containing protein n=1 Tax=Brassica carinata TaxID=52824 RepID=A0A8X7UMC8_BRACI|nr:hypothetical protein Bca52824_044814 [Brassica carinata]
MRCVGASTRSDSENRTSPTNRISDTTPFANRKIFTDSRTTYADHVDNDENQTLYVLHQILESWIHASLSLLNRIDENINEERFGSVQRRLLAGEDLEADDGDRRSTHPNGPGGFLKLKKQLQIKSTGKTTRFASGREG